MKTIEKPVTFKDGTKHIEIREMREDGSVGKFIKYKRQEFTYIQAKSFIMPFGRFKGETLGLIPPSYLKFLAIEMPDKKIGKMADYLLKTWGKNVD
jgi:uncharacterized protein (DUF3820 family)